MKKTHFRKVFKSDHLGSADLEEYIEEKKPLIFTIKEVRQEYGAKVAGKKIDANIAYFTDLKVKPLVLNATNSKVLKKRTNSSFIEDWKNIDVELYIDKSVKMKGEVVGGVRIKDEPPRFLNKKEIDVIKGKVIAATTMDELTKLWNSDTSIKLNSDLATIFKQQATHINESK